MTTVADWTPAAGSEPEVRVGIVLPSDGATRLRLIVPDAAYDLLGEVAPRLSVRASGVDFRVTEGGVAALVRERRAGNDPRWVLRPRAPVSGCGTAVVHSSGANAPAVHVGSVVAGRGFHWEAKTDQLLPGELWISSIGGRLLLACRLPVEEYLAGVIAAEMSGDGPLEFLTSHAVVARSWTLAATERKHAELGIDLCNDDCCQRYQGVEGVTAPARLAVGRTRGLVLVTEAGGVVDANYAKCCGGIVEAPEHVWGKAKAGLTAVVDAPATSPMQAMLPVDSANFDAYLAEPSAYCNLSSVGDAGLSRYLGRVDRGGGFYRWTVSYARDELEEILRRKGFAPPHMVELLEVRVTRRGVSGRAIEVNLLHRTTTGATAATAIQGQHNIRTALHPKFLFSSAFRVTADRDANERAVRFRFDGAGWGHGVGLCQIGALGMALAGYDHRAILAHYFPAARLGTVYS